MSLVALRHMQKALFCFNRRIVHRKKQIGLQSRQFSLRYDKLERTGWPSQPLVGLRHTQLEFRLGRCISFAKKYLTRMWSGWNGSTSPALFVMDVI